MQNRMLHEFTCWFLWVFFDHRFLTFNILYYIFTYLYYSYTATFWGVTSLRRGYASSACITTLAAVDFIFHICSSCVISLYFLMALLPGVSVHWDCHIYHIGTVIIFNHHLKTITGWNQVSQDLSPVVLNHL